MGKNNEEKFLIIKKSKFKPMKTKSCTQNNQESNWDKKRGPKLEIR